MLRMLPRSQRVLAKPLPKQAAVGAGRCHTARGVRRDRHSALQLRQLCGQGAVCLLLVLQQDGQGCMGLGRGCCDCRAVTAVALPHSALHRKGRGAAGSEV